MNLQLEQLRREMKIKELQSEIDFNKTMRDTYSFRGSKYWQYHWKAQKLEKELKNVETLSTIGIK